MKYLRFEDETVQVRVEDATSGNEETWTGKDWNDHASAPSHTFRHGVRLVDWTGADPVLWDEAKERVA